jgi:hypothetical protein
MNLRVDNGSLGLSHGFGRSLNRERRARGHRCVNELPS